MGSAGQFLLSNTMPNLTARIQLTNVKSAPLANKFVPLHVSPRLERMFFLNCNLCVKIEKPNPRKSKTFSQNFQVRKLALPCIYKAQRFMASNTSGRLFNKTCELLCVKHLQCLARTAAHFLSFGCQRNCTLPVSLVPSRCQYRLVSDKAQLPNRAYPQCLWIGVVLINSKQEKYCFSFIWSCSD